MRNRAAVPREELYLAGGEVHGMHRDQVRRDEIQALQPLERPHAVLSERAFDLVLCLVHMYMHRDVELRGERRDLAECRVRNRVRRMRRQAKAGERLVAVAIAYLEALAQ